MKLRVKPVGAPEFEVDVDPSATVADFKIEATAGCSIDPDSMQVLHRGRVLKDDDTLAASGVGGREALVVAQARAPPRNSTGGGVDAELAPAAPRPAAGAWQLRVRGPGGVDAVLQGIGPDSTVADAQLAAAALCGLPAEQARLLCRARLLKDEGATLLGSGVADGDTLHVARKAAPPQSALTGLPAPPRPDAREAQGAAGAPMPAAWGAGPATLQGLLAGEERAVDAELLQALARQMQAPPRAEPQVPLEVRIGREVRAMEREVRLLVAEQHRREAEEAAGGVGPARPLPEQGEEDAELLDEIARQMAEARARGAPVPNARQFVARGLQRAQERRQRQERLLREAQGFDPDLEDALAAAEQTAAAAARAPRRLGRGDAPAPQ
ncbi:unnamed protein product [Prorocentrum cordatum]|uniref:Ubiquitin-like domain-containing protein n=1 Tax=Prorocentrum cordatum TaxID=2364126 RepID=A0ABN9TGG6_9DINO|nr:unnamed protein product [Polarella glacialis]